MEKIVELIEIFSETLPYIDYDYSEFLNEPQIELVFVLKYDTEEISIHREVGIGITKEAAVKRLYRNILSYYLFNNINDVIKLRKIDVGKVNEKKLSKNNNE